MAEKHPKQPSDEQQKARALNRWENEGGAKAKPPKRPRDLNAWARRMVDIATGETEDREPTPEEQGKDPAAVKRGRLGGKKGGKVRASRLTPEERSAAASKAVRARWQRNR